MKNKKILEIGSGNSPRQSSTILTDRYLYNNLQRAGDFKIVVDRPFIVSNGYNLPFPDKSFDFVICSHVLEHLDEPEKFVKEIERVGKAGHIEIPNIYGERLFGWDFHLWYCQIKKNKLLFNRKRDGIKFEGYFHKLIVNQIWFRRFFEENESFFYIKYNWNKKINIQVSKSLISNGYLERVDKEVWERLSNIKSSRINDFKFYIKWTFLRIVRKIKKEMRKFLWKFKIKLLPNVVIKNTLGYIQCPFCKNGKIEKLIEKLICIKCKYEYKLDKCIPILLLKDELKKGY